jgi:MFS family permease
VTPVAADDAGAKSLRKPKYFYGWNIAGASFLAHTSYAEQNSSLLGLFFDPLRSEFGWTRTGISGAQSLTRLVEGMVAPLIGPLVDRRGPRLLMVLGGTIVCVAFLLSTLAQELWHLYVLRGGLAAIGFALVGGLVTSVTLSQWFVRKRGRVIAIVGTGNNLSTFVLAPLVVWAIVTHGWRSAFVVFAVLTLLVVVIPSGILMRRRPEDMGLRPDGDPPDEAPPTQGLSRVATVRPRPREPLWSRRELVRSWTFWSLVASFAMSQLAFQGINIAVAAYALDLGHGAAAAAGVLGVRAVTQLVVAPVWGIVSEHAERPYIRVLPFLAQGLSCVFFLLAANVGFLWLAVVVYALGFGGASVIQEVVWANYFGRLTLGLVRSTALPFVVAFSAAGPLAMNAFYDNLGSYQPAFAVLIPLYLGTSVLMWASRPPVATRFAEVPANAPPT